MWRVVSADENTDANKALVRNALLLVLAFALMMAAASLLIYLESEFCAIGLVTVLPDGSEMPVCKVNS